MTSATNKFAIRPVKNLSPTCIVTQQTKISKLDKSLSPEGRDKAERGSFTGSSIHQPPSHQQSTPHNTYYNHHGYALGSSGVNFQGHGLPVRTLSNFSSTSLKERESQTVQTNRNHQISDSALACSQPGQDYLSSVLDSSHISENMLESKRESGGITLIGTKLHETERSRHSSAAEMKSKSNYFFNYDRSIVSASNDPAKIASNSVMTSMTGPTNAVTLSTGNLRGIAGRATSHTSHHLALGFMPEQPNVSKPSYKSSRSGRLSTHHLSMALSGPRESHMFKRPGKSKNLPANTNSNLKSGEDLSPATQNYENSASGFANERATLGTHTNSRLAGIDRMGHPYTFRNGNTDISMGLSQTSMNAHSQKSEQLPSSLNDHITPTSGNGLIFNSNLIQDCKTCNKASSDRKMPFMSDTITSCQRCRSMNKTNFLTNITNYSENRQINLLQDFKYDHILLAYIDILCRMKLFVQAASFRRFLVVQKDDYMNVMPKELLSNNEQTKTQTITPSLKSLKPSKIQNADNNQMRNIEDKSKYLCDYCNLIVEGLIMMCSKCHHGGHYYHREEIWTGKGSYQNSE